MVNKLLCSVLSATILFFTSGCKQKDLPVDDIRAAAETVAQASHTLKDAKRTVEYAQQQLNQYAGTPANPNNTASAGVCDNDFYQRNRPIVPVKQTQDTQFLCFNGFSVLYSGVTRTPLWSAEHLTKDRLIKAKQMPRVDNFHEEPRLPHGSQARLEDYRSTGYDRGHLSPNGDMADTSSQYDSFSLVNIAPQDPELNRNAWMYLESNVRKDVFKYGEAYVVTGVVFLNPTLKKLNRNVTVPTHFFKAVLIPTIGEAKAYISENNASGKVQEISLSQLTQTTGVQPFPSFTTIAQANTAIKQ